MQQRDIILVINHASEGFVRAIKKHNEQLNLDLKGIVLVERSFVDAEDRDKDGTGLFTEIVVDFDKPDELQAALKPYLHRIAAVSCTTERAIEPLGKVLPFLPYTPRPSESALIWSSEKHLMRDRLRNYDPSLVPRYHYLHENQLPRLREIVKDLAFPVIVKPSNLAASLLVTRCENMDDLVACMAATFGVIHEVYKRERRTSKPQVLVEELIQGDMYSTDAYVGEHGEVYCLPLVKVITAESIGLPGYYSYRHIIPVGLSEEQIEGAFTAARSAIHALNLNSSSTHIELFLSPNGWKIIEVGARIGGYRYDLYNQAYGIDHYYNDLAIRMGREPEMPGEPIAHAAGFNIYPDKEGVITAIEGVEEARKIESVVYITVRGKVGSKALFASKGGLLIVDGILSNQNPEKLEQDMARVRELIKIHVK